MDEVQSGQAWDDTTISSLSIMVTDSTVQNQTVGFDDRLRHRAAERRTWLCLGLDPEVERLPPHFSHDARGVTEFCTEIIGATHDLVAAFKINFAFFEALGPDGWKALADVRDAVPSGVPVIGDAKRGDIGNTAKAYARAIFDILDFDAVTLNPYLGRDSVQPFLEYTARGVLVLCKTSNPGAADLQDQQLNGEPLFMTVARRVLSWQSAADRGLVVGATQPEALRTVRALSQETIFLVPGVGAQGATAEDVIAVAANAAGDNALISVSRNILYSSSGLDFAAAARQETSGLARATWAGRDKRR